MSATTVPGRVKKTAETHRDFVTRAAAPQREHFLLRIQRSAGNRAVVHRLAEEGESPVAAPAPATPSPAGCKSPRFSGRASFEGALAGTRVLRAGSLSGEDTSQLQGSLQSLGFDPGPVDGVWGPKTNAALASFQRSRGLSADSVIGPQTMRALDDADTGAPMADVPEIPDAPGGDLPIPDHKPVIPGFILDLPGIIPGLPGVQPGPEDPQPWQIGGRVASVARARSAIRSAVFDVSTASTADEVGAHVQSACHQLAAAGGSQSARDALIDEAEGLGVIPAVRFNWVGAPTLLARLLEQEVVLSRAEDLLMQASVAAGTPANLDLDDRLDALDTEFVASVRQLRMAALSKEEPPFGARVIAGQTPQMGAWQSRTSDAARASEPLRNMFDAAARDEVDGRFIAMNVSSACRELRGVAQDEDVQSGLGETTNKWLNTSPELLEALPSRVHLLRLGGLIDIVNRIQDLALAATQSSTDIDDEDTWQKIDERCLLFDFEASTYAVLGGRLASE